MRLLFHSEDTSCFQRLESNKQQQIRHYKAINVVVKTFYLNNIYLIYVFLMNILDLIRKCSKFDSFLTYKDHNKPGKFPHNSFSYNSGGTC